MNPLTTEEREDLAARLHVGIMDCEWWKTVDDGSHDWDSMIRRYRDLLLRIEEEC